MSYARSLKTSVVPALFCLAVDFTVAYSRLGYTAFRFLFQTSLSVLGVSLT